VFIAAMIFVGKLLSLPVAGGRIVDSFEAGDFLGSEEAADGLFEWNWFEPWIASFDRGTATAAGGDYNAAIPYLEDAFAGAPEAKRCDVAVNLALSWELLGDSYAEQGQAAGAQRLYDTARAVIAEAGEGCSSEQAPPNPELSREPGQELEDADERLQQKSEAAQQQDEATDPEPADGQEQLDQLEEQNDAAAEEKSQLDQLDRGQQGGGFADRPW
jgi:tetratricopeptide (TPR) repeat protein